MAFAPPTPGDPILTPPTAAESNRMSPNSGDAKPPLTFKDSKRYPKVVEKLARLKNTELDPIREKALVKEVAFLVFSGTVRGAVKNAKDGATGQDVMNEIDSLLKVQYGSSTLLEQVKAPEDIYANHVVYCHFEDTEMRDESEFIEPKTPPLHPDDPELLKNSEPEKLELPPLVVDVMQNVVDKQLSPSNILVPGSSLAAVTTIAAPCTPKRELREGSPLSKIPVLKSPTRKGLDALDQREAGKPSGVPEPVEDEQNAGEIAENTETIEPQQSVELVENDEVAEVTNLS